MAKGLTTAKPEPSGRFSTAPSLAIARQICSNDTASAATAASYRYQPAFANSSNALKSSCRVCVTPFAGTRGARFGGAMTQRDGRGQQCRSTASNQIEPRIFGMADDNLSRARRRVTERNT